MSDTPAEQRFELPARAATLRFGRALGALLRPGDVLALMGDLGAGKTTLTQAIAQGMGIAAPVTSPTFTLVQEYPGPVPLFHFDPYRLEQPEQMFGFGFDDYFERGGVIVIEWANKISDLLPPARLELHLQSSQTTDNTANDEERLLYAVAFGERYVRLLNAAARALEGTHS